ncbi:MAG: hemerythrin domain-containing protein [Prevotellaceae bacterium]|jgi:regulator of cell morphogenesis and NO signaling|nr:hemerythrin domain-containing protein [Prevotellaceae bacterium]
MHKLGKYKETDSMGDLITEHYRMLLLISRFGIALGFGDKNIGEVCRESGVDVATFLAIVNMLFDEDDARNDVSENISIESLLSYLHNTHDYFLNFRLPAIRAKLYEAIGGAQGNLSHAIMNYFDEYVSEVQKHMMYEEKTVFPYVRSLLGGEKKIDYNIDVFSRQHDRIEARLTEFKQIIIKYYPVKSTNELNNVLNDIFNCERDLALHNAIEDRLFVPSIMALEKKKDLHA